VALARSGYYDGAVAGAIGSQVINVTLGVGVPALLVSLFGNGYLSISQPQANRCGPKPTPKPKPAFVAAANIFIHSCILPSLFSPPLFCSGPTV
jgi:Ca2+/Na+ antiporter